MKDLVVSTGPGFRRWPYAGAGSLLALLPLPADLSGEGRRFEIWAGHWGRTLFECVTQTATSRETCQVAGTGSALLYVCMPALLIALGLTRKHRVTLLALLALAASAGPTLRLLWFASRQGSGMSLSAAARTTFAVASAAPDFSAYALLCNLGCPAVLVVWSLHNVWQARHTPSRTPTD